jgi:diaminohydroxyphosphoribosylaminopyrimidine deaminase / 5-amino-6-(5-phosphoribosylamino)uracil reductase
MKGKGAMNPVSDIHYMREVLRLARKGDWKVRPNPQVGAIIVKDGKILGKGFHSFFGGPHAEVEAIHHALEDVKGSTLYVNLEPCSFHGKTPACTDLIIQKGIGRVVCGMTDPNPLVSGKGISMLREAGIEVVENVLNRECLELNAPFSKFITQKLPYVTLKAAMTLDGKTATITGESKWITSAESRKLVHKIRRQNMAVMIGVNTAIADDPLLTARMDQKEEYIPLRIVVDSRLRIPFTLQLFNTDHIRRTLIATTPDADHQKIRMLQELGAEVLLVPAENGKVNLKELMVMLGNKGIDSILLEGGASLHFSALNAGIVDKIDFFIAPRIVGGLDAIPAVGGEGVLHLKDAFNLANLKIEKSGVDLFVEAEILQRTVETDEGNS